MKKKLLISALVLVLLMAGVLVWALLNADALVERARPELERVASRALGTNVGLGKLHVSVFPSAQLIAREIAVGGESAAERGLELASLKLSLSLMDLLRGALSVHELTLDRPRVTLVQGADGFSLQGLPKKRDGGAAGRGGAGRQKGEPEPEQASALSLDLRRASINDGEVTVKLLGREQPLVMRDVDLNSDLALEAGVISAARTVLSAEPAGAAEVSLVAEGVALNQNDKKLTLRTATLETAGSKLAFTADVTLDPIAGTINLGGAGMDLASLSRMGESVPEAVRALALQGAIVPDLKVQLAGNSALAEGAVTLRGLGMRKDKIALSDFGGVLDLTRKNGVQIVSSKKLEGAFNGATFNLSLASAALDRAANTLTVTDLQFGGFSGTADLDGMLGIGENRNLDTTVSVAKLDLGALFSALSGGGAAPIEGTLESLNAELRGVRGDQLPDSLSGNASLRVVNGVIPQVNLAADVLRGIRGLPFLSGALYDDAPQEHRSELDRDVTTVKELTSELRVGAGRADIQSLRLVSSMFTLRGAGSAVLGTGELDLKTEMLFNPELSERFVAKTKELAALLDEEKRLIVPVAITGRAPKLRVLPDMEQLAKRAAKHALRGKVGESVEKAIGDKLPGIGKEVERLLGF